MRLDNYQRLFLYNQLKILKTIEKTSEYDNWMKILYEGFESRYDDLIDWLYKPTSEDISVFVMDVLDMFRGIERYKEGNPSDVSISQNYNSSFGGFDGNHEEKYYGYASFLINDEGKWNESKAGMVNTHCPMVDKYRRMINIWKPNYALKSLTKTQVEEILVAAKP